MNQSMFRNQLVIVLSMVVLMILASVFGIWQNYLETSFGATFDFKYMNLNLWIVPVAALIFALCGLILYRFTIQYPSKVVALLFLILGISILFYPPATHTLGISSKLGITGEYFGSSVLFYFGAMVSAIGITNLLKLFQNKDSNQ